MKGFVPTPPETVDGMVELLFRGRPPGPDDRLLDPGCGTGAFIEGILRWCAKRSRPLPRITGVESDPRHLDVLRRRFDGDCAVEIVPADFLLSESGPYDFIIGNPPYVAITGLSEDEKQQYRARFVTAYGRFDLYMLFFEQALAALASGGRLVFITPEKYLYVDSAAPLRRLLAQYRVEAIDLVPEDTFGELVTYPTITSVHNAPLGKTGVSRRDGSRAEVDLPQDGSSWLPTLGRSITQVSRVTLADVCVRLSCGVATGADQVFVHAAEKLPAELRPFARPTVAGRELVPGSTVVPRRNVMLIPYDAEGRLLPEEDLGALRCYLMQDEIRGRLLTRTCVRRKPWYAFHETPMLPDMLRPKILFKDIGATPQFWVDWTGDIVPRHSVYYLVPPDLHALRVLLKYLESPAAHEWLRENCQRAASDYLRLQSRVLQRMPLPDSVAQELAADGTGDRAALRSVVSPVPVNPAHKEKTMVEVAPR
ncbi:MAG: methyltransferase [Actinobacteria bacterium]|jgi:SAM-dependent methyltransferase|nr:methyltransferase [Actinomycetota bacterium]